MAKLVALSLKQPWAALLAGGVKVIEVRSWQTKRRGQILIHASRNTDDRPGVWDHVPPELLDKTKLAGGIIGTADLVDSITYWNPEAFTIDRNLHLNDPAWFDPPRLYGFRFRNAEFLQFQKYSGNVRFFSVPADLIRTA